MKKTPFVTLEKVQEIAEKYPTPFHLYDEQGIQGILCSKGDTEPVFDQDPAGVWLRL